MGGWPLKCLSTGLARPPLAGAYSWPITSFVRLVLQAEIQGAFCCAAAQEPQHASAHLLRSAVPEELEQMTQELDSLQANTDCLPHEPTPQQAALASDGSCKAESKPGQHSDDRPASTSTEPNQGNIDQPSIQPGQAAEEAVQPAQRQPETEQLHASDADDNVPVPSRRSVSCM